MEKQGFYVVLTVCVLVIALSAAYTFHFREEWESNAVFPEKELVSAAGASEDESLKEAMKLVASMGAVQTVVPTQAPFSFTEPVSGILIRDYSVEEPQLFAQARYWRIHPGMDFQADYGSVVKASSSGRVKDVWQDHELGLCIRIAHDYGYETVYAGLSDAGYVRSGDAVLQGQTIGHVGNGVLAEMDAQPHLHFEVWKNGSPADPVKLFLGVTQP